MRKKIKPRPASCVRSRIAIAVRDFAAYSCEGSAPSRRLPVVAAAGAAKARAKPSPRNPPTTLYIEQKKKAATAALFTSFGNVPTLL
jgi:hypothetical protein